MFHDQCMMIGFTIWYSFNTEVHPVGYTSDAFLFYAALLQGRFVFTYVNICIKKIGLDCQTFQGSCKRLPTVWISVDEDKKYT